MRRLLLALLLACSGLVLVGPAPAFACSCAQMTFGEQLDAADTVVSGTLEEIRPQDGAGARVFVVAADRLYQGDAVPGTIEFTSPVDSAACGLPDLELDTSYVFLLADEQGSYSATSCTGPQPLTAGLSRRIERRLGEGTTVDVPEPAVLTPAEDSEPTSFTALAAPGGALVIVGLLGLVLARTLGRD